MGEPPVRVSMAIETILLAVGGQDEKRLDDLVGTVTEVAEPTGASVVVAHVFDEDEFDSVQRRLKDRAEEDPLQPDQVAGRLSSIRGIVDAFDAAGIRPEVRGAVGERAPTVVALAEEVGADRVVIGGRARSPAGKAVFGSTAQEILLTAPCPVTFVRSD